MTAVAKARALCIGVANYINVRALPDSVLNDARDVAALLRDPVFCGYPASEVHVVLDGTKAAIETELAWLAKSAVRDETVLIFFSGHGARDPRTHGAPGYLLPVDAVSDKLPDSAIASAHLTAAINAINAQRVVVLLDACHAAATGDPKGADEIKEGLTDRDYADLAQGSGRVVMASSQPNEVSWVRKDMSNSLFTDAVLRALRGEAAIRGDGFVRVMDVFHYVSERVPRLESRQHPIFKAAKLDQNFPLSLYRGGSKEAARPASALPRDGEWWRTLETTVRTLYPTGPGDTEIWGRAGGDVSTLRVSQSAIGMWHNAITALKNGGGGANISIDRFIETIASDFAANAEIEALRKA